MATLELESVNRFVLFKQHLIERPGMDNVVQIVKDIGGLHATGTIEPYLSLFARASNIRKESLDEELHVRRRLAKIRCMRGTLHILAKEMIPSAHAATREMVEKLSTRYAEFRGISMPEYETIRRLILELLTGREMTASEIKKGLETSLPVSAVLNLMCDQGLLIRTKPRRSWKSRSYEYAIFDEYLEGIDLNNVSEDEGITHLVLQHLSSFGPATEDDIAWWTGLGKTKVRKALNSIKEQLVEMSIPRLDGEFLMLRSDLDLFESMTPREKPAVSILPTLDPYLMGYKQRDRYLRYEHYDRVFDRSGNATSTILVDGRVVGVWDFSEDHQPFVKVLFFEELKDDVLREIHSKSRKVGRFIGGKEVQIRHVSSMPPLPHRTAGAFMSPLRDCE